MVNLHAKAQFITLSNFINIHQFGITTMRSKLCKIIYVTFKLLLLILIGKFPNVTAVSKL